MKNNIPYSAMNSWETWLNSLTPPFQEMIKKEELYVVKYVRQDLTPEDRVIEIGCGSGRLLQAIYPYVGELIGLEHDYLQVQVAERSVNPRVKILFSDGRDIPYPEDYFHLAFSMFNTLGNQGYDKFRFLREMRRVVKSRENVIVSAYAENAAEHQVEFYKKVISDAGDNGGEIKVVGDFVIFESNVLGSYVSERFSKDKLFRLFRDTWFVAFDIEKLTDFSYVVKARK